MAALNAIEFIGVVMVFWNCIAMGVFDVELFARGHDLAPEVKACDNGEDSGSDDYVAVGGRDGDGQHGSERV